ncbi:DUF1178 family protein [Sphingobium nicotianae]|uniref:DUF1178 family protein n=1 Tax=Sphingobium nicotianae TaxID=2782607 RepID=A0A9X1AIW5_9SPHN|nr:DUF1178 family protein [Sphingobium nicotianae]MBT2185590.1 DUF1178 family protein [Sphingobium nicotianae]
MISFDLRCAGDHVFEIWFRSGSDFDTQRDAGQISCPVCGDRDVAKAVMAPAIAAKGNQRRATTGDQYMAGGDIKETPEHVRALMSALAEAQAAALKDSVWVGDSFADKARAMHYGEVDSAAIHGTANAQEARAMMEEGLAIAPLLVPIAPPDKTN